MENIWIVIFLVVCIVTIFAYYYLNNQEKDVKKKDSYEIYFKSLVIGILSGLFAMVAHQIYLKQVGINSRCDEPFDKSSDKSH